MPHTRSLRPLRQTSGWSRGRSRPRRQPPGEVRQRNGFARLFCAARRAVSVIRLARVCGRRARLIHSRMPRRTDRGKAVKCAAASGYAASASARSSGTSSRSTSSRNVQAPSACAASTAARPAGAIKPAQHPVLTPGRPEVGRVEVETGPGAERDQLGKRGVLAQSVHQGAQLRAGGGPAEEGMGCDHGHGPVRNSWTDIRSKPARPGPSTSQSVTRRGAGPAGQCALDQPTIRADPSEPQGPQAGTAGPVRGRSRDRPDSVQWSR